MSNLSYPKAEASANGEFQLFHVHAVVYYLWM